MRGGALNGFHCPPWPSTLPHLAEPSGDSVRLEPDRSLGPIPQLSAASLEGERLLRQRLRTAEAVERLKLISSRQEEEERKAELEEQWPALGAPQEIERSSSQDALKPVVFEEAEAPVRRQRQVIRPMRLGATCICPSDEGTGPLVNWVSPPKPEEISIMSWMTAAEVNKVLATQFHRTVRAQEAVTRPHTLGEHVSVNLRVGAPASQEIPTSSRCLCSLPQAVLLMRCTSPTCYLTSVSANSSLRRYITSKIDKALSLLAHPTDAETFLELLIGAQPSDLGLDPSASVLRERAFVFADFVTSERGVKVAVEIWLLLLKWSDCAAEPSVVTSATVCLWYLLLVVLSLPGLHTALLSAVDTSSSGQTFVMRSVEYLKDELTLDSRAMCEHLATLAAESLTGVSATQPVTSLARLGLCLIATAAFFTARPIYLVPLASAETSPPDLVSMLLQRLPGDCGSSRLESLRNITATLDVGEMKVCTAVDVAGTWAAGMATDFSCASVVPGPVEMGRTWSIWLARSPSSQLLQFLFSLTAPPTDDNGQRSRRWHAALYLSLFCATTALSEAPTAPIMAASYLRRQGLASDKAAATLTSSISDAGAQPAVIIPRLLAHQTPTPTPTNANDGPPGLPPRPDQ